MNKCFNINPGRTESTSNNQFFNLCVILDNYKYSYCTLNTFMSIRKPRFSLCVMINLILQDIGHGFGFQNLSTLLGDCFYVFRLIFSS
jgi:hypothetical protein